MHVYMFGCQCLCRFSLFASQTNKLLLLLLLWVTHSCSWAAQRDERWDETIVSFFLVFFFCWQALKDNKAFINTCK